MCKSKDRYVRVKIERKMCIDRYSKGQIDM